MSADAESMPPERPRVLHEIRGTVIRGDQRGRSIGFPTANLRLPEGVVAPEFGVYSGLVDGKPAAVSIGVRPTFGSDLEPLLEAYLLDFDGDLYGQEISVKLLQRIRGEIAFGSVTELVEQMRRDVEDVRRIVAQAPTAD